jgi:hypothetical protein
MLNEPIEMPDGSTTPRWSDEAEADDFMSALAGGVH